ncbi:collectin-10 isoform X2 [Oreochromis niloticus]|uniref:collectin-10 isoform X2 n=1 Tax=Oreochromis niloticus TaxID=8128 RepID=UPI000DF1F696|nr:collectin-10 isoform X2 [Oreochromis niloticus]
MLRLLVLCVFVAIFSYVSVSIEVCTSALIPGAKGDQGEIGDDGDQGKLGKNGPPGLPGVPGEPGLKGELGHTGKIGPTGDRGDKGDKGLDGPAGLKGKQDTRRCLTSDHLIEGTETGGLCERACIKSGVVLGLRETEERYYLLVKEPKRFREALMNCKLRGGTLAMPKSTNTNRLMADYVSQAGLTRVYIGVQTQTKDVDGSSHVYADSTPLQGFASWSQEEELQPNTNSSCVELLSTGTWAHVECEATMFFICEFPKSRRRGGGREPGASASS